MSGRGGSDGAVALVFASGAGSAGYRTETLYPNGRSPRFSASSAETAVSSSCFSPLTVTAAAGPPLPSGTISGVLRPSPLLSSGFATHSPSPRSPSPPRRPTLPRSAAATGGAAISAWSSPCFPPPCSSAPRPPGPCASARASPPDCRARSPTSPPLPRNCDLVIESPQSAAAGRPRPGARVIDNVRSHDRIWGQ
jgi:hypothetical protein